MTKNAVWRNIMADKAKLALVIIGGVIGLELFIVGALGGLSIVCVAPVPSEVWELLRFIFYTTLTGLIGVAGAQALNGKVKNGGAAGAAKTAGGDNPRIPL